MLFLFTLSTLIIVWAYFGYPFSMRILANTIGQHVQADVYVTHTEEDFLPNITVIIAAANEEKNIDQKLTNTIVDQDYPRDKVEIIVALDGSTDRTADIVRGYEQAYKTSRIVSLNLKKGGKESAQYEAVQQATGIICVFTDVATRLRPDGLRQIVQSFKDPDIGAVDGMSQIEKDGHSNEGLYLKYENKIREWESMVSGLVSMGGCLFAARTFMLQDSQCIPIPFKGWNLIPGFSREFQSDFRTALVTKIFERRAVIEPKAVAIFADGAESKEFDRKHRTVVRGMNTFFHHLYLLNPLKYGWFSYQFFCHKLLKWLVPFAMIGAFVSNFVLVGTENMWFWLLTDIMLLCQSLFYGIAIGGSSSSKNKVIKIIHFFVLSNLAILKAWFSYAKGERYVMWTPTVRK